MQSGTASILFGAIAFLSFYATPFIDPLDDFMDSSGRVAGLITAAGGFLIYFNVDSLGFIVGLAVNVVNAANTVVMVSVFFYGIEKIRTVLKNWQGNFTFGDTGTGKARKIVPHWDRDRDCKHRIWHLFWDGVLPDKCGEEVSVEKTLLSVVLKS